MRRAVGGLAVLAVLMLVLGAAFGPPVTGEGLLARATEVTASVLVLALFGLVLASIAGIDWRRRL